jgi:hypothetical protein
MTYIGKVKDGVVVLSKSAELPEGTVVRVLPVKRVVKSRRRKPTKSRKGRKTESLSEMFLSLAGTVKGLPSDMAKNHDHYLYGLPKK